MLRDHEVSCSLIEFSCCVSLRRSLERGVGFTVCPRVSVQDAFDSGSLVPLAWDAEGLEAGIFMIRHREKWCSPLLERFMALAREVIASRD